jgi:hypothetical protein
MFSIEPLVTKELLLQRYPEEQYMSFYLGVPIKKGLFRSPLRVDNRDTCSFYRSDKTGLRFKDFGNGVNYNFIDVVMALNSCSYHRAMQIIATDFGIVKMPNLDIKREVPKYNGEILDDKEPCDIKVEIKDFTEKELSWWKEFGISKELLKEGKVYSARAVFINGIPSYFSTERCPIYGYFLGHEEGRELWKIYFPTKLKYRFLLNTSRLQGTHMLPKKGDLVVITKSMKDVLTLKSLGISAIAPQSENSYPKPEQINSLMKRFDRVLIMLDNDRPGMRAMATLRKMYRTLFYWIPKAYKVKDISDFRKKYGEKKSKEFIEELLMNIEEGNLDYHYKKHDGKKKSIN